MLSVLYLSTNQSNSSASYLSQDNSGKSDPVVATTVVSTFEVAKSRYYKIPIMHWIRNLHWIPIRKHHHHVNDSAVLLSRTSFFWLQKELSRVGLTKPIRLEVSLTSIVRKCTSLSNYVFFTNASSISYYFSNLIVLRALPLQVSSSTKTCATFPRRESNPDPKDFLGNWEPYILTVTQRGSY